MNRESPSVGEGVPRPFPSRPPPVFTPRPPLRAKERVEPPESPASMSPIPEKPSLPSDLAEAHVHETPPPVVNDAFPPPSKPAETVDPFEEEMARLLGRAPGKDG